MAGLWERRDYTIVRDYGERRDYGEWRDYKSHPYTSTVNMDFA